MLPEIVNLEEKILVGKKLSMSFSENKTAELWRSFMPERKNIKATIGNNLYSVQLYSEGFFENFNPHQSFDKWATVEVNASAEIPNQMETIRVSGLYAVFHYKGNPNAAQPFFQYIFKEWLPKSAYILDNRFHFEILGENYKNNDPDSEEDIYIPIRLK